MGEGSKKRHRNTEYDAKIRVLMVAGRLKVTNRSVKYLEDEMYRTLPKFFPLYRIHCLVMIGVSRMLMMENEWDYKKLVIL